MCGKLIDGKLVYAPKSAIYNNVRYSDAPAEVLIALGYKEIADTPMPTDAPELHRYVGSWKDGKNITRVWTLTEYTTDEKIEYYKQKLNETDKYFIEYSDGCCTLEEYEEMKAQRQAWRDAIEELQK